MTVSDRQKLDEVLDTFNEFMDFVKFTNDHNIIFELEEWEEYRDKVMEIVSSPSISIDLSGLILP